MKAVAGKLLLVVACLYTTLSVFAQTTEPYIDSLVNGLRQAGEDSNKVKLLMELGNNVGYYDAKQALAYAQQGFNLSNRIHYPLGIARTTYLLGNTYLDLNDYDRSKQMLDKSDSMFEKLERTDMIGMINNARGNWYYMQSDMWNAAHYYTKATEIFHALGDSAKEIFPYNNLIAALGEVKSYDKAIALSLKLLDISKRRGDTVQVAHVLNHLVVNYTATGNVAEAKKYIQPLVEYISYSLDHNLAAESYNAIGNYYARMEDYTTAITYYQQAVKKALRDNYQVAIFNQSLGAAYLAINNMPVAFKYLSEAARLAKNANSDDIYYNVCGKLAEYYARNNDYKNAYKYLSEYTKLNDSILVADTRQYANHLEAVYENNKKEQEILRLKAVELEKSAAIKKRNAYLLATLAVLGMLGILLILQTRNAANKRRLLEQEKALQEERIVSLEKQQQVISLQSMIAGQEAERTRIARDLHDGLGGLFSTVRMYFSSLEQEVPVLGQYELFKRSCELTDNASVELRRIAHNLMPEVLMKLGLINAIRDICNTINAGRLLKISVLAYGMEERLQPAMEIMLFRIVQELLNNIVKHSHATEVIVQVNKHDDRLSITIEDNGQGFNVDEVDGKVKSGISTVKSRVNYLNGKLNIDSRNGVGTTVSIEFLLEPQTADAPVG